MVHHHYSRKSLAESHTPKDMTCHMALDHATKMPEDMIRIVTLGLSQTPCGERVDRSKFDVQYFVETDQKQS